MNYRINMVVREKQWIVNGSSEGGNATETVNNAAVCEGSISVSQCQRWFHKIPFWVPWPP